MEDLLYTLLVVGWIAFGIYKGIQKNKKGSPQKKVMASANLEQKKVQKTSALEAVFGELFDLPQEKYDKMSTHYELEDMEESPKSKPVSEIHLEKEALDSYSGTDSISSVFKDSASNDAHRIVANKDVDSQYEEEGIEDEDQVVDLRQAIIHQVILDRPY